MSNQVALVDQNLIPVLRSSLYPGASDNSIKMVMSYCQAASLDPIQKPVHIVPMWDNNSREMRDVIMPGIGLYRTIAARSGCCGITEPEFGEDVTESIGGVDITYPKWCKVTVKRKMQDGTTAEFTAKEFWKENFAIKGGKEKSIAPNAMWSKRPYGQIAKCAEAQALRKGFPEVGAAPTAEEMEGKSITQEIDITPESQPVHHTPTMLSDDQVAELSDLLKQTGGDESKLVSAITEGAADRFAMMTASNFNLAKSKLLARLKSIADAKTNQEPQA